MNFFDPSYVGNGCQNSNLMNSKIVIFACHYSRNVKKLWYFKKQNIPRQRENYVKFFSANLFVNGCRNNNLMNSQIVTFACPLSGGMSFAHPLNKIIHFACPLIKKYLFSKTTLSGGITYLIFFSCSAHRVFELSKLNILYVIKI